MGAMELLFRMSPLAAVQCLLYAAISGEFGKLKPVLEEGRMTFPLIGMLVVNASMAFFLNTVSFQANKLAGALTMSVCGNMKQCMTIMLGIVLFSVQVTPLNGVGMLIALGGSGMVLKSGVAEQRQSIAEHQHQHLLANLFSQPNSHSLCEIPPFFRSIHFPKTVRKRIALPLAQTSTSLEIRGGVAYCFY